MKKILIALCFCCGPAAAQQPAVPAAPEASALAAKYNPEIMQTMKNLSVLMEKAGEIPPERLQALAPEISAFNGKVKAALGDKILAEVALREKAIEDKARTDAALKTLQAFRAALQVAYTEAGGKYPKSPAELAPRLMQAVPELYLPGHDRTAKITVIDSKKYDKDVAKAVTDSGGWLFFSNPESVNYGLLVLDCSHPGPEAMKFFEH